MGRPGDIIITTIITTGHRITGHRIKGLRIVRLPDRRAAHPGRHRCLQKDNISVNGVVG